MEEPRGPDIIRSSSLKATMRKLVTVSKADLDAKLKEHSEPTLKKRPGRKPKRRPA